MTRTKSSGCGEMKPRLSELPSAFSSPMQSLLRRGWARRVRVCSSASRRIEIGVQEELKEILGSLFSRVESKTKRLCFSRRRPLSTSSLFLFFHFLVFLHVTLLRVKGAFGVISLSVIVSKNNKYALN